jgi:amidase
VFDDLGQIGALSDPRSQIGLFARYVSDLSLLFGVVAGPDGHDAGAPPVALGDPAEVVLADLTVGWFHDGGRVTPATAAAVRAAAVGLAETGARVRPTTPPDGGQELTVEIWRSYENGAAPTALLRRWDAYRARMLEFMSEVDLILCPVYPVPAPPHGGTRDPNLADGLRFTTPYSLTGAPCVVLPYRKSSADLPIGVQLIGAPWQDHVPLAAAEWLERGTR